MIKWDKIQHKKDFIYISIIIFMMGVVILNQYVSNRKLEQQDQTIYLLQQQITAKNEANTTVPFKKEEVPLILNDISSEYKPYTDANMFLFQIYGSTENIKETVESIWKETVSIPKPEESSKTEIVGEFSTYEEAIKNLNEQRDSLLELENNEGTTMPEAFIPLHSQTIETIDQALRYINSEIKYMSNEYPYSKVTTQKNLFMSEYNHTIEMLNKHYGETPYFIDKTSRD